MKIALGSDHAGYKIKEAIKKYFEREKIDFKDFGVYSTESFDYPDIARVVSFEISSGRFDYGILVCGTGTGMSIAANKVRGIRAALVYNEYTAEMAKKHNNANIITLSGRVIDEENAIKLVKIFLNEKFEDESRHIRRIKKIEEMEIFSDTFLSIAYELKKFDEEVFFSIYNEFEKQEYMLNLIASENIPSFKVLLALFNPMQNKYAEGYPGRRYYGGCEFVDVVENLAIERVKKIFSAEGANVQPHSGTQANQAVFLATLNPQDKFLGMELSAGGHLSHGHHLNMSGKIFTPIFYSVDPKTELIDMDMVRDIVRKERPRLIIAGASSYPRVIDFKAFSEIAKEVSAYFLADVAHPAGLIAAGLFPNPTPYADFVTFTTHKTMRGPRGGVILFKKEWEKNINSALFPGIQGGPQMHSIAAKAVAFKEAQTEEFKEYQKRVLENARELAKSLQELGFRIVTGGTDSHIVLVDLTPRRIRGGDLEKLLYSAGIVVNKNVIPYDKNPPLNPSGIRIGTPTVTQRGMGKKEMREIAKFIDRVANGENPEKIKSEVKDFLRNFPYFQPIINALSVISK